MKSKHKMEDCVKPSKFVKNQLYWEKIQYSTSHWILNEVFLVDNSIQKESDPVSPFILIWNLIWSLELAGGNLWWLFCLKRKKTLQKRKKPLVQTFLQMIWLKVTKTISDLLKSRSNLGPRHSPRDPADPLIGHFLSLVSDLNLNSSFPRGDNQWWDWVWFILYRITYKIKFHQNFKERHMSHLPPHHIFHRSYLSRDKGFLVGSFQNR